MTRPILVTENSRSALMASEATTPPKLPQIVAAFVCTLSVTCAGIVFSWTSFAVPAFEKELGITVAQGAWIGSLVTLGAFLGAIPAGKLAHLVGRKRLLQVVILPLFLSWILIAYFYHQMVVLYLARFLAGISTGCITVVASMYVSEMAHISIRGTVGTFFQVQMTIGILLGYLLGDWIPDIKLLSLAGSLLPLIFLLATIFVPESPVYLCEINDIDSAQTNLRWFRGEECEIEGELLKTIDHINDARKHRTKIADLFNCKATFRALIISFGLMTFQQLSGVNAVIFYVTTIFEVSKSSLSSGECTVLVGVVQVLATLLSTIFIERAGRKILLIISILVMCLSLMALSAYFMLHLENYGYLPLTSVALFVVFFSIGFGPIPWMIMGEILPAKVKGTASSLSVSLNWFLAFIVTNQFTNMVELIGIGAVFLVFSIVCLLGTVFVIILVPETKGRSIEEVSRVIMSEPDLSRATVVSNETCNKITSMV